MLQTTRVEKISRSPSQVEFGDLLCYNIGNNFLVCIYRAKYWKEYDLHTINIERTAKSSEGKSVGQIEGENKLSGKVIPRSGVLSSRRRPSTADIVRTLWSG